MIHIKGNRMPVFVIAKQDAAENSMLDIMPNAMLNIVQNVMQNAIHTCQALLSVVSV